MKPKKQQWALINPPIKNDKGNAILPFIVKIKRVDNKNKLIRFSLEDFYHTNGGKRMPSKFWTKGRALKFLDFAAFDWIAALRGSKQELMLN